MEGILEKPSRIPGKKTKVWSVLDETTLSFFQENKRSSCIGSVELTDIQSVKIITEYQFELVTDINSQIYTALSQEKCKEWVQKLSKYSKGQTEVKQSIPKPKSAKNIFESTSTKEFTTASSRPVSSVLSTGQHGGEHTVEVRSVKNLFESQSTKKEITTSNTLVYSSTFTEKNKSAHTVEVKSSSHIAQASSDIKKFHTNPVIDVSISKGEVKLARNIFETLSTHKKPTPPPKPVSSTIPRISPESKRITSDPASSHPWSTIEDVRSRLHHVNTSNRVYNHPGSETSFSEQENLKRSEELKLEDARINLKPVSILKEDNKENNEATQGKEEETSEISSDKINDTIGISGDFNIVEHSTQSENDLKEIEEIGVLEMDNSKKVKMSERENNGDRVCNTRPDSGYCTTVGERGRNSKENESDETNRSSSVNVSEIINQKTNTADIISRIPDPDEQSGGKMELDQEPKEAALLVHKSNGSVNVSCSNVVTLNKQSDETNRSSSENVLEKVNQRTNTAEITSQTTESDEQNGDTVEQEEEQRVSIVQLRKSKRNVSVTHNDAITVLAAGNQADTQENYPPLAFPNTRGSQTSSSSSESENKDRTTISSQNIIDKSKLEENENKAASTELDQKEARNLSTSHHDNVDGVVESVSPMHKSNGSVNVSCSDLVTLNKQSDKTNRSSSENVLENVNQRTNTAEITSQTTESDEQNGDTVEQEEEQRVSIVQLRKSKRSVSVTHNDAITVLAARNQADTQENYPPLAFPNTRGSQTSSSSSESENKDRTMISSQNIIDKSKLEENENKAASTELDQKEARNLSTSHHDNVDGVVESVSPMHKSNGSVNVSCSDLVTLNKQSDETNRSSSENVLENVNQRTNTAEITSQTTESDEQNGDTVEQEEEQRVSIVQLRKSKRSVSVTHNDAITVLAAGNQADTQENYPPLAFPNTRGSQTSSSSSESENKDRTTISSQNIIDKSKLEENENKAASTELDQKEARNLSTSHHDNVDGVVESVSPMHKSNGSVNVSCSDLVTLNKQSDKTNRSSSENVLENVNQRINTAEITSQTTESDEQNGDTVEQEEEQRVSIVQLRKSKRSVSVTHNDVISVLAAGNQADTQENYPPLAFPNTRRSQTSSSSSESENKDRTTISSQNIIDKSKLEENEIKAASTELDQKEERKLSTSHHELVENYLDIDFLISKANFPNIPALPNTTPSRADLISFHELKDTLDTLGSEDECSEVPSEDDERSEVNSTSSDQIIQRLSRLVES